MNPTEKNTILITGGGSGIGRGLAEAFHKLGNKVVIAGRRKDVLEKVAAANPGMEFSVIDVQDAAKLKSFVEEVNGKYPSLNVLINMAGVMKPENYVESADASIADDIIATNLTAPIHLTAALLPLLKKQEKSTVMTVTSGLAFTPLAITPTYCATKAAMHSWSVSLRYQLRDTSVEVLELAPPYVQTELMGEQQANDPRAMPLADFIDEVMEILSSQPEAKEILVKNVLRLRFSDGGDSEKFYGFFEQFNAQMAKH